MSWRWIIISALLLAWSLFAQEIPAGTVLPVMLQTTLNGRTGRPGQPVRGKLMQDVLLPAGERLSAGAEVTGRVVRVSAPNPQTGSQLVLEFNRLVSHRQTFSMTTNLRAVASMMAVFEAQLPTSAFDDYGTSTSDWTTFQVGGDAVYRGAGDVVSPTAGVVGRASDSGAVTATLTPVRASGCRGAVDGNDREQALWVFSTSACGTYGFPDLRVVHAGRTEPVGQITLESSRNVYIERGSGWLLRVQASSPASISQP